MGRTPAPHSGNPGFATSSNFMGVKTPVKLKIRPIQPLPPIVQPVQPIRRAPPGGPFTKGMGNRKTLQIPGAPTLPNNPYADAAWRRGVYGPK
jgi:hypothetical protein